MPQSLSSLSASFGSRLRHRSLRNGVTSSPLTNAASILLIAAPMSAGSCRATSSAERKTGLGLGAILRFWTLNHCMHTHCGWFSSNPVLCLYANAASAIASTQSMPSARSAWAK